MKLALPLAAAALVAAAPSQAAVIISDFDISFTAGATAVSSGDKTAPGEYQDNFHFTTYSDATFSGSLSTQRLFDDNGDVVSDLDFGNSLVPDGVHLDGFYFDVPLGGTDALEVVNLPTTFLAAGDHTLTVNYTVQTASGDNAAVYAGPLFLATTAVPEPATWALMVIGIGAIGASMRRRTARVAFS